MKKVDEVKVEIGEVQGVWVDANYLAWERSFVGRIMRVFEFYHCIHTYLIAGFSRVRVLRGFQPSRENTYKSVEKCYP